MRRAALAFAIALCGCSPGQPASKASAGAVRSATGYALRSNVSGDSLVRLAELPSVKALPIDPDSDCEHFVKPVSAAARLAAQKGWRILREQRFHQFQTVLIARGGEPLTSARCNYIDSNIAFFEGDRLIGILYPKGKDSTAIAWIDAVDGHLRLWSTDPVALGQVNLNGTNLTFDAITGSDQVCNGRYQVPAVFGLPYAEARPKLIAAGWRPVPSEEPWYPGDADGARRRYPEVDSCAGTGYGECSFTLVAKDSVTMLGIATLGGIDDASVSDYDVACGGKPEQRPDGR